MNSVWTISWSVAIFCAALVASDPQTNLLLSGCNQYNPINRTIFIGNLNRTLSVLRSQISVNNSRFAVAQSSAWLPMEQAWLPVEQALLPVYGMLQCRNYMNRSDCLQCFNTAQVHIRTCSLANSARVIYDGCLLRYEPTGFSDQTTGPGNEGFCGNRSVSQQTNTIITGLLSDLVIATPRIDGYFAASIRQTSNRTNIYAVAQCAPTITTQGCADCLTVAYRNLGPCFSSEGRSVDVGCFVRYSDRAFFASNQTIDITLYLRQGGGSSNRRAIIGGAVGGGGALILILVMLVIWFSVCKSDPKREHKRDILGATESRGPTNFEYKDLSSATNNFREENKLGKGGFGDVFKGTLKNGKIVAVKRLAVGESARVAADFESEVKLISNIHHRNLIRLLGYCSKSQELLLVYEYMANKSLDTFLFGEKKGTLTWKQRLDIIVGTARGLAYLHEEVHVCIIHRDIKSNNILLDDDLQPRIADFGLAMLLPEDQSHINTKFAGTLGYTAPEYAIEGHLSTKVDTYSYGVVTLEIISGRRSTDVRLKPVTQYLLKWAWTLYEEDMLLDLVEENLDLKEYDIEQVKNVIEVALLCTQSKVFLRPTMSEVVVLLLSKGVAQNKPTRPNFIDGVGKIQRDTSSSGWNSNATVSVTQVSGR